jgi:organic radical activating enzyme
MYKLPWSTLDNQGGWIEVTDRCNITCPGCYRQRMEGDKPLEKVKEEILRCKQLTKCDSMVIAGGEPLIYPQIIEVVRYVSSLGLKPLILTNGTMLTPELAGQLKNAGLKRIHFHVDERQDRKDWIGKNEEELNELRQHYADLIYKVKGIQCGFHITVIKETLENIPVIMKWYHSHMHQVQHLSLIALSGMPVIKGRSYFVKGTEIPEKDLTNSYSNSSEIGITTEQILDRVQNAYPDYVPSAYINGDGLPETNKQLFIINIGTSNAFLGVMGAMSMELTQAFSHLFYGKYYSFASNPAIGKKVFLLSIFDKQMRKTFLRFLKLLLKKPQSLFYKIYLQSLIIQQPIDFMEGEKNTCDHCVNPMVFKDILINPCELDEFRVYGDLIVSLKKLN